MSRAKASPFYDQAKTHIFSDWLVPYIYGVGSPDLEEFYLGGLPDLSTLIERRNKKIVVNFKEFSRLERRSLTPFGRKFRKLIRGKIFFDLGCGIPSRSVIPRLIAQQFKAASYKGIDISHLKNEVRFHEFSKWGPFRSEFIREDLLNFMKTLRPPKEGGLFFLGGVELKSEKDPKSLKIHGELLKTFRKKLKPSDLLLLGAGTFGCKFKNRDFNLVYEDPYHSLFVRR